ncbi:MAG: DNA cytosine methyltransferase [Candidatus Binatia bacterium]
MPRDSRLTAVDLFCGAGGLTLGLKRAGFDVVAAVEVDPEIAKTYKANHPKTRLLIKDIRYVTGQEILASAGLKGTDLVAGCPPCQGFSSLTSKYKKKDPRNGLLLEMARVIEEVQPRMVMLENVPGLADRGKRILNSFVLKLKSLGYRVTKDVLQLADYGVPQSRRRFVLLAGKGFEIPLPKPTHSRKGDEKKKLKEWLTLADIIEGMKTPVTLSQAKKEGGPRRFRWHVVKDLKPITLERLRAVKPGASRYSLPMSLRPKCHANDKKGFPNVYGRLSWRQVPPTITSGCTTPCMGRYGHPSQLRTISVREAALIQTFPKSYKFETEFIDTACDLVGNALPPKFAEKAARACIDAFTKKGRLIS